MPRVIGTDDMRVERGEGWTRAILADARIIGEDVMVVERWDFSPHATGPERIHGRADQLLYVISGGGVAVVDGEELELKPESILWLESGERYRFQAGDRGLQVLQGLTLGETS